MPQPCMNRRKKKKKTEDHRRKKTKKKTKKGLASLASLPEDSPCARTACRGCRTRPCLPRRASPRHALLDSAHDRPLPRRGALFGRCCPRRRPFPHDGRGATVTRLARAASGPSLPQCTTPARRRDSRRPALPGLGSRCTRRLGLLRVCRSVSCLPGQRCRTSRACLFHHVAEHGRGTHRLGRRRGARHHGFAGRETATVPGLKARVGRSRRQDPVMGHVRQQALFRAVCIITAVLLVRDRTTTTTTSTPFW